MTSSRWNCPIVRPSWRRPSRPRGARRTGHYHRMAAPDLQSGSSRPDACTARPSRGAATRGRARRGPRARSARAPAAPRRPRGTSGHHRWTGASRSISPWSTSTRAGEGAKGLVTEYGMTMLSRVHGRLRAESAKPPLGSATQRPSCQAATAAPVPGWLRHDLREGIADGLEPGCNGAAEGHLLAAHPSRSSRFDRSRPPPSRATSASAGFPLASAGLRAPPRPSAGPQPGPPVTSASTPWRRRYSWRLAGPVAVRSPVGPPGDTARGCGAAQVRAGPAPPPRAGGREAASARGGR